MKRQSKFPGWAPQLLAAAFLLLPVCMLRAQSTPIPRPSQNDNPFPAPASTQSPATPEQQRTPPKPAAGDNPFPGEDPNAPIIPVDPGPDGNSASGNTQGNADADRAARERPLDPDGDPVRAPDGLGNGLNDGFSSSRTALSGAAADDTVDSRPGRSTKTKTREELLKEDVNVGTYYLERKNWKAAQSRFDAAFELDRESADAVWGLAEAERHLQLVDKAREHYTLFLTYDPDGPHGRAARKALEQLQQTEPAARQTPAPTESNTPK